MAANHSTSKVIRVTEKELEIKCNSLKGSVDVIDVRSTSNACSHADKAGSNSVGIKVDNENAEKVVRLDSSPPVHEKEKRIDEKTVTDQSSHSSMPCTQRNSEDRKGSTQKVISDDPKGRVRRVRKGYEVYKVKRGKFSEKVVINESDFRLSDKRSSKEEVNRKSLAPKEERSWHPDNPPPIKDDSSVPIPFHEDWDSEKPTVDEMHKVDSFKECWDTELASPNEKPHLKVNDKAGKKDHQHTNKNREFFASISSDLKKAENSPVNRQEKNSKRNTLTSNVAESYSNNYGRNNDQKLHSHSSVEEAMPIGKKEGDRGKQNLSNHKPKEEQLGSVIRQGIGRGRRSKASNFGLHGQSMQTREEKDENKFKMVSRQVKKGGQPSGQSGNTDENKQPLPQKTTNNKKHHEKGKAYDKNVKDAKKKDQFSNEKDETNFKEDTINTDTSNNTNKTAGILVLPSPINEGIDSYDVQQDENSKPSKEVFMKKTGFSKLERPDSFDPNKPRGDAKFVKEKKEALLIKKKDLRVSSSSSEIWDTIQSECSKLQKLLSNDLTRLEDIEKMLEFSIFLQDLYKELIVKHFEFSFKNYVEGSLWKNTFHNVITAFRTIVNKQEPSPFCIEAFQFYWNFLQDGDDFLKDLLSSIQAECKFDLEAFFNNPLKMTNCKKQQKLGIRSCHLILLNLGDLERYIADLQQTTCYVKANENYLKAQTLAPKNGKPYNQLAIVAVKNKMKLDAVYYYIRSLEASNPIESARERLTAVFHEIKKKADLTKMQSLKKSLSFVEAARRAQTATGEEGNDFRSDYSREDIWVFYCRGKYFKAKITPNGKIHEFSDTNAKEEEQSSTEKVSLREANKEFLIYYLYMHSKLYSRIGFEHVMTVYEDTIQPFKVLLKHNRASSVKMMSLIKYMAINIFAVDNLFRKQECNISIVKDSPIDVAIIFGMDMSAKIAEHCCSLIEKKDVTVLLQFLPSVHVWMKWMSGYLDLIKASSVCYMRDIWESYMTFLNLVRSFEVEKVEEMQDGEPAGLCEEMFLLGFKPLMDMENQSMKVAQEQKEKAEVFMRLESLKDLSFMISDSHKVPVVFNEENSLFEVVMPEDTFDSPTKDRNALLLDDSAHLEEDVDSDVIIEDAEGDIDDRELQQLKALKAKKMELTAQFNDRKRREQERAAIVQNNASQVHIISENHPKFIVPDTNCFIDYLDDLVRILESKDFNIILPLTVVNELDGLKKGRELKGHDDNVAYVQDRARLAIELLEKRFSENDKQLKAVTSAGTELETIAFRDEELSSDKGKNDDIILSCCLHYCEEATNRFASSGGPLLVQRKVLLLTDDRNLRLKAHSRHVPTLSMKIFLKMAHLS